MFLLFSKDFSIYIAFLLVSGVAMSQPGFMGKKNWVEGNLLLFSAMSNPTATQPQEEDFYQNVFHLNKTLALTYHRVLDRKRAIGFEVNLDATGFYWQPVQYQSNNTGAVVDMYTGEGEVPELKIRTKMVGVSYLKYAKRIRLNKTCYNT